MPINDTIYAYSVGRVRALETRLLDRSRLERMIEAHSAEEALKVLSESDYAGAVSDLAAVYDFESMLAQELKKCVELIGKISPRPELISIMSLRYDIHNLKVLFKSMYLGIKSDLLITAGSLDVNLLSYCVTENDFRDLPGKIRLAAEKVVEDFSVQRDPQLIDLTLDRVLFEQLLFKAREHGSQFMQGMFVRQVDLVNLKSLIRVKRMGLDRDFLKSVLLPGGIISLDRWTGLIEEPLEAVINGLAMSEYAELAAEGLRDFMERGTASRLEKLSDDYITTYLKKGKWSAFGLEPLIGYLWAKEIEIKNIRLILVGKINKLPASAIRERLRDVYI